MSNARAQIKELFDQKYAALGISLPDENRRDQRGVIDDGTVLLTYIFGSEQGEEYLEYFFSHRMTNDTLRRMYADGREELLGYCLEFYLHNDEQAKQAYYEHNRQFYEHVKRRGLG